MTITSTHAGDTIVLRVAGRLDAITSPEFEKTCQQCINSESRRMMVDFEGVDYISSAGLRAILLAGKAVHAGGGVLGLSGLRGTVKDTLEMAGFCALLPVYDSMEAALEPR
jgi:anti-anti-sigma factor